MITEIQIKADASKVFNAPVRVGISGPVFRKMRVFGAHSQETPCFDAVLLFAGVCYHVSNDGRGGCNRYSPMPTDEAFQQMDEWAAENNPPFDSGIEDGTTLKMDFETWTFCQAFDKLEAQ